MVKRNIIDILVVDHEVACANILHDKLSTDMRQITTAYTEADALSICEDKSFDIIIANCDMPQNRAQDLLLKLREHHPDLKLILFIDVEKKEQMLGAIKLKVNQFFTKPFDEENVLSVINTLSYEILENRRTRASLQRQDKILHAIKEMSEKFLQQDDWNKTLYQQMDTLKKAVDASSIFIFKNQNIKNPIQAERYLSINDNYEAYTPNLLHYKDFDLLDWKKQLQNSEIINGTRAHFNIHQQQLLDSYKIRSLLMLPIFAHNRWWGFLGIGNSDAILFDQNSLEILQTVTRIIAAAITNQQSLNEHKMRSAMFEHTMDGIIITDVNNKIISVNPAFSAITGFKEEDVIGKDPKLLKSSTHDKHFYQQMWQQLNQNGYWQGEIKNRRKNDELYIGWLSINIIKNSYGEVQNYMGIFSDITQHRDNELNYAHLATHDPLTGLANRLLLDDRLEHAINHAQRFKKCAAVIFCDLDNFKPINDNFGHHVGDETLIACANYFKSVLRADDTICRYGGDEFVIIISDLEETQSLDNVTQKLSAITQQNFNIFSHKINVKMSVGISIYPRDASNAQELLETADKAMYNAKHAGKNRVLYFSSRSMHCKRS